MAPTSGTVTVARFVVDRPVVTLLADDGWRVTFEPATSVVPEGTRVTAGEVLAEVGGASPHAPPDTVHWGVRDPSGSYMDPLRHVVPGRVVLVPLDAP